MDVDKENEASETLKFNKFTQLFTHEENKSLTLKIKSYHSLTCQISNIDIFQPNSLLIANCSDKTIKVYDLSLETLQNEGLNLKPFRTFNDVVLKRKFAGGMFYIAPEDN